MKQPDSDIQFEAEKTHAIAMPEAGETETEKTEREREVERDEGIVDRGSPAAPSDRPENRPPHPQDVNDLGGK